VIRLRLIGRSSIPVWGNQPSYPDRLWGPPNLLFNEWDKVAGAEVKNGWIYTFVPLSRHCVVLIHLVEHPKAGIAQSA
jgi:hypothetical protein